MGRFVLLIACVCASQLVSGCLYLHNPTLQKAAEAAKSDFEAVAKNSPFSAVVGGYVSQTELTAAVARDVHRLDRLVKLNALVAMTWADLKTATVGELNATGVDLQDATQARDRARAALPVQLAKLAGAKEAVKTQVDALNDSGLTAARYAATQSLLREALVAAAETTRPKSVAALRDVLGKKHSVTTFATGPTGLTTTVKEMTAGELLGISAKDIPSTLPADLAELGRLGELLKSLPGLQETLERLTFRSPGIATTLLGLGFDLARAEEQRIAAAVDSAKREIKLRDAHIAFLELHRDALRADLDDRGLGIAAAASVEKDEATRLRVTLERLVTGYQRAEAGAAREQARGRLHAVYLGLANNFKLQVVDAKEREIFKDRISALQTEQELRLKAVGFAEREAIIGRGLEGLVAFHSGGVTTEDVARLIGIAQTIGIFVIAGGQ